MLNLLREQASRAQLIEFLAPDPRPVLPPFYADVWRDIRADPAVQRWLEELRQQTDAAHPSLDGLAFGAGTPITNAAFYAQRAGLARAAMLALLDEQGAQAERLAALTQLIDAYLSEPNWSLPKDRQAGAEGPPAIDIPSAETANSLAEIIALFGEVLPSDLLTDAAARLNREFFEPYLRGHEELGWTKSTTSLNAACHQGVLGAALTLLPDRERLADLLLVARRYLSIYLKGFGNDGACPEGPGYWQYGFGRLCILNDQLESRSENQLSLLENDPKIRRIAAYGPRVSLSGFRVVNFGDTLGETVLSPAILRYLGSRLDEPLCRALADTGFRHLSATGFTQPGQQYEFSGLARLLLMRRQPETTEAADQLEETYFADAAVLVSRGRDEHGHLWEFAAKGGDNAEPHNHNDCGSYLLHIDGQPAAVEIGAPEFSRNYLREGRYRYLAARTLGHSLPIVNGHEQAAGPQSASRVLAADLYPDHAEFSVDLTACYPSAAACQEIIRSFKFDKRAGELLVCDSYDLSRFESFETSIICEGEPSFLSQAIAVTSGSLRFYVEPLKHTLIAGIERHEYRALGGVTRVVHRIILKAAESETLGSISYRFTLAEIQPR